MKILHVVQFLGIGGLEKVLLTLVQKQIANGHKVTVLVYDYEQSWIKNFQQHGITVDTSYRKCDGYDLKLINFLRKKIRTFDIVHSHDLNPIMYLAPLKIFGLMKGKKLIHTTHGMEDVSRIKKIDWYERLFSKKADVVTAVGKSIYEYYQKINTSNLHLITNGIEVPKKVEKSNSNYQIKRHLNLEPSKNTWVYVARVFPLKDQKILIDVFKELPNEQLLIIGPATDEKYFNELALNLTPNICLAGAREDICSILTECDYYISASHHEGIPISVLEAAAVGLPCLLSDIPGHHFGNNEVAFYFSVGNKDDLKNKIETIIKKPIEAKLKSNHFLDLLRKEYCAHQMYQKYMQVYVQ